MPRRENLGPEHPDTPARKEEPPVQTQEKPVNVIEIVSKSSALNGMKIHEVTAAAVEYSADSKKFLREIKDIDTGDHITPDKSEEEEEEEDTVPVMAGERARRFSNLPLEFDGEPGPARRCQWTAYAADEKEREEATTGKRKTKTPVSRAPRKLI